MKTLSPLLKQSLDSALAEWRKLPEHVKNEFKQMVPPRPRRKSKVKRKSG